MTFRLWRCLYSMVENFYWVSSLSLHHTSLANKLWCRCIFEGRVWEAITCVVSPLLRNRWTLDIFIFFLQEKKSPTEEQVVEMGDHPDNHHSQYQHRHCHHHCHCHHLHHNQALLKLNTFYRSQMTLT